MISLNWQYHNDNTYKFDKWFNYTDSEGCAKISFIQIKFLFDKIGRINQIFSNVILVLTKVNSL